MSPIDPQARSTGTGIILTAAAIMVIGLVAIASASINLDGPVLRPDFWRTTFGRQAVFTGAGLIGLLLVGRIGYSFLQWRPGAWVQPAGLLLLLTIGCLALVLVPGIGAERHGARRWLQFGPASYGVGFQPSELAKLGLIVFLAAYLARGQALQRRFFKDVLPAAGVIGLCAALVGVEDFGTAFLLAAVGGIVLLTAGATWWHLAVLAVPAAAAFGYLLLSEPYRVERLTAFTNIWADPQGAGYHPIQSLVTIASGGWFGRGLGMGTQKFGYLPESKTDFIFAIWCEETGLVGALLVIMLFGTLLYLGIRASNAAADPFGRLLAFGVTLMVALQAVMNIAVVTVSVPTKGIGLPLMSAGGSGVVFLCAAVGLLAGVAWRGCYAGRRNSASGAFLRDGQIKEASA